MWSLLGLAGLASAAVVALQNVSGAYAFTGCAASMLSDAS